MNAPAINARGRPRNPATRQPGMRGTAQIRLGADLWHRLDGVAREAGHSLSMEIELRLEYSFRDDQVLGAIAALGDRLTGPPPACPTVGMIRAATARYFGLMEARLTGPQQDIDTARARDVALYLAQALTGHSLTALGQAFGGRDHSTAAAAVQRVKTRLANPRDRFAVETVAAIRAAVLGDKSTVLPIGSAAAE